MAIDFADDYDLWDGTETVTHNSDSVENALWQSASTSEGGQFNVGANERICFLPGDNVANAPVEGDTITDASAVVWNIKSVSYEPQTDLYECACVQQR